MAGEDWEEGRRRREREEEEEEDAPEDYDERELSLGLRLLFDLFIVKLIVYPLFFLS